MYICMYVAVLKGILSLMSFENTAWLMYILCCWLTLLCVCMHGIGLYNINVSFYESIVERINCVCCVECRMEGE